MKTIAERCEYFSPEDKASIKLQNVIEKDVNCTMCKFYDHGLCNIKDEILTSMDQT